jgi:hypothetical protein
MLTTKRLAVAGVAIALAVGLAACGGSQKRADGTAAPKLTTAQQVIDTLSQHGVTVQNVKPVEAQLYSRENVSGDIDGDYVEIATFDGTTNRDQYVKVARQVGGGMVVVGDTWVMLVNQQTIVDKVRQAIGGVDVTAG